MKNTKERVFAYTQSKKISVDELQGISGGETNMSYWTHKACGQISGANGSWDTVIDVVLDW